MRFEEADLLSGLLVESLTRLEKEIHLSQDPTSEEHLARVGKHGLIMHQLNQLKALFPELIIPESTSPEKNYTYVVKTIPHDVVYNDSLVVTEPPTGDDFIIGQVPVGIHVSITYEEGFLNKVITRGSGVEGEDVTLMAFKVGNLPLGLSTLVHYKLVVQGIIGIKIENHNAEESPLTVRNYIAGVLRGRDNNKVNLEHLTFMAVDIFGSNLELDTYAQAQGRLKELGFDVLSKPNEKTTYLVDCLSYTQNKLKEKRQPIDARIALRYIQR